MNGPQHYAEAERLIDGLLEPIQDFARGVERGDIGRSDAGFISTTIANSIAAAQVHATLALAAATVDVHFPARIGPGVITGQPSDWARVTA